MAYTDPDLSSADKLNPDASPGVSTKFDDSANSVGSTDRTLSSVTDGKGPEQFHGTAAEVKKQISALADAAVTEAAVAREVKKAVAEWRNTAPKAEELNAAEKAVADAQAASTAANATADAQGATPADQTAADTAGSAVIAAKQKLMELVRKRKEANKALLEALGRAAGKLSKISLPKTDGSGSGYGPGEGTPGAVTPATPTQVTPATPATAGSGSGKAPGAVTPATPGAKAPGGSPESKTGSAPESKSDVGALLAALQNQQQGQQPPAQQAQGAPTATQPAQQQQPQKDQQGLQGKGAENAKKDDGVLDLDDVNRMLGEAPGAAIGLGGLAPGASSPSPASQPGTTFRPAGTPITGTGLGGTPAVNQQTPPTTGTSTTGLHTASDVSGRSTPAATAFSPTPAGAETKTSASSGGTGTGTGASPMNARGAGGMPGMPMMPPVPMGGGAPAAASGGRQGDGEDKARIEVYGGNGYHGEDTLSEAVRGGTIAQNRPNPDAA